MGENSEIGLLISNIIDKNHYSHCRLCLELILDGQCTRFQDMVAYSSAEKTSIPLKTLLYKIFGEGVSEEIPGIDAVCKDCLNKTIETYVFIQQYQQNNMILNSILDNLNETLAVNVDANQIMYIMCDKNDSKLILVEKDEEQPQTNGVYKCKDCKETFHSTDDVVTHNLSQHDLYTCDKCLYTSTQVDYVNSHLKSTEYFHCDYCKQYFCTKDTLEKHIENTHKIHTCSVCGKSYKGLDKLRAHKDKHIIKNSCPKCGKTYLTKEYFEKHVKLCLENNIDPHPMRSKMEKKFVCKDCGKGYKTAGGLRVHERFVHGNAEHHICTQCGKKFTAPCLLKAHQVTHTKEKNFPCDLCDGRFVTKEALLYHRRRHTGEKPYPCDQCSEAFVNASARADHMKFKHIGPTLSCEFCSKKFVTKIILKNHMKKHHDPSNKLYMGRADIPHDIHSKVNTYERDRGVALNGIYNDLKTVDTRI